MFVIDFPDDPYQHEAQQRFDTWEEVLHFLGTDSNCFEPMNIRYEEE